MMWFARQAISMNSIMNQFFFCRLKVMVDNTLLLEQFLRITTFSETFELVFIPDIDQKLFIFARAGNMLAWIVCYKDAEVVKRRKSLRGKGKCWRRVMSVRKSIYLHLQGLQFNKILIFF